MTMNEIRKKMRKANHSNYTLYFFCNFIGLLLITAYASIMYSPTVQNIFPEGGDSRKQMMAIFALACVGCVAFTLYAASLFFRMRAKEIGVLMALGASKKRLSPMLTWETMVLSGLSALFGTIMGIPFAFCIWQLFRLIVVDSGEMKLVFDVRCLFVSAAFFLVVVAAALIIGLGYLKRTNIMEVIYEEHRNEAVPEVKSWCGPFGILLLLFGAVAGYFFPSVYRNLLNAYPPAWLNLLYVPVLIGLYMILLHTVARGWGKHKYHYKGLIARSMMKFQGRQTVNHMLVVTVLIAGACFGIFYLPMLWTGSMMTFQEREADYFYNYRADQNMPDKEQILQMAEEQGVSLRDWREEEYLTLGMDGNIQVMDDGSRYHYEYSALQTEGKFLSAGAYKRLTGQDITVPAGSYCAVNTSDHTNSLWLTTESSNLTNMSSGKTLAVRFSSFVSFNTMADHIGYYVLNDSDYIKIAEGLTDEWKGRIVCFNETGEGSYAFANALFNRIVDAFGPECAHSTFFSPAVEEYLTRKGESYWATDDPDNQIRYEERDTAAFRMFWAYMPKFRILDKMDNLRTLAVFLMMFLFIALICLIAALVICFTRCITIAVNNRYVFDDLRHLGASPGFLKKEVKRQSIKVFAVPSAVGMGIMYLLYSMIMYANDGRMTSQELWGLAACFGVVVLFAGILYAAYRMTVKKMVLQLNIY